MIHRKFPESSPPPTDAIDAEWAEFSDEAPTAKVAGGGITEMDRPTAIPSEPPEQIARRLMASVMTADEERKALSSPSIPAIRDARGPQATLVDVNAGLYDGGAELEAAIPLLGSIDHRSGAHPIPLDIEGAPSGGALDLVASRQAPCSVAPPEPLTEMRDRYAVGDFSGALALAERILGETQDHQEAARYAANCRDVLRQMYTARLGSLRQVPRVALPSDQIRWLTLDHRSGFLLSCVDGRSTLEEILDVSGMPVLDALRILCDLQQQSVIEMVAKK
jgi:hypothetical protein